MKSLIRCVGDAIQSTPYLWIRPIDNKHEVCFFDNEEKRTGVNIVGSFDTEHEAYKFLTAHNMDLKAEAAIRATIDRCVVEIKKQLGPTNAKGVVKSLDNLI